MVVQIAEVDNNIDVNAGAKIDVNGHGKLLKMKNVLLLTGNDNIIISFTIDNANDDDFNYKMDFDVDINVNVNVNDDEIYNS